MKRRTILVLALLLPLASCASWGPNKAGFTPSGNSYSAVKEVSVVPTPPVTKPTPVEPTKPPIINPTPPPVIEPDPPVIKPPLRPKPCKHTHKGKCKNDNFKKGKHKKHDKGKKRDKKDGHDKQRDRRDKHKKSKRGHDG